MMRKFLQILLVSLIISSCGEFQKVLKSDDYNYKYEKAVSYYESDQYNRAMPLFNELSTVMRGTSKIQEVSYYYAYCNYSVGENLMAAYLFRNYTINFPNSKHTEECAFMSAFCYYNEAPVYSLDATNTSKAIKELQGFIDRYPSSDRVLRCNDLIDELRGKLSRKAFENAKQYYRTESYKSAIIALDNVLIDFPSFNNREEVHYLIVRSSYLLAKNSISTKIEERLKETLDVYSQFKDNYPKSQYLKELESTYNNTQEALIQLKKEKNEI
ncbi:MAG: outer membrane protein assembly factor BamD [Flavobacteriales bacterium]|nr:outer membrane protein assembly factor BamD [Flavobacteriales bacterium]|tara:strand:- start:7398 stop:8210 length:813 start_codon:yes stop_codon:yes gene_type:complete